MARVYGLTEKAPEKPLSGQAKAIYDGMKALGGFHSGKEWTEVLKSEFKTRQDPYRVVLYYLLILKDRGLVAAQEVTSDTPAPAEHANTADALAEVLEKQDADDSDNPEGNDDGDDDPDAESADENERETVDAK